MTIGLDAARDTNGGVPARRAMVRWAWRMFRREWRQQFLILALIIVAVAAVVVGSTVATTIQAPANAGFGTAQDMATIQGSSGASQITSIERRFGRVDVIENKTLSIPGSIGTFDLRAQNPHGAFGQPMLSLVSGHFPTNGSEVAMTSGVASEFGLKVGSIWRYDGAARLVTGIVQNPQSLLDEFALVVPGQVKDPSQVTVLFDAGGVPLHKIGPNVSTAQSVASTNILNPNTVVLALATLGMLLIALVSIGGFTVLAQRRSRSIGMIESLGATDRNVRLTVCANGVVVGVVGTLIGTALGIAVWLAYRPHAESSSHHLIAPFDLPWQVIGPAMGLAVLATFFAASRPAQAVTKVPIITALSGRPAPPKQVHRSAVPGVVVVVAAFFLLNYAGSQNNGGGAPEMVFGFVALIVGVILLSPLSMATLTAVARHAPVAVRLALRDLVRYRSRSASALAAISLGVLIAVVICVVAASRYGNVLDYAGPNLASNQLIVYTPSGNPNGPGSPSPQSASQLTSMSKTVGRIGKALGASDVVALESSSASIQHLGKGRQFSGQVYVATPALLKAFGINSSQLNPNADILSMRPGFSGISNLQLTYGSGPQKTQKVGPGSPPLRNNQGANVTCGAGCLANPVVEEVGALPSGTSAPNTVVTEHAVRTLHLQTQTAGWLIQASHPFSAAQLSDARLSASKAGMQVETKNDEPTSAEIINWATVFGIVLALGVLAMSVGLIRSETASDLRTLVATGASGRSRRTITAATAGALALLGAVLGTVCGYVASLGYFTSNSLDGVVSLTNIPVNNLLVILVGMPLVAVVVGWLLAGRQPAALGQQPID
jgi:putative ABC transport system permease protein